MPLVPTPCALLMGTPDHTAALSALAALLQPQGWQVHQHAMPSAESPTSVDVAQLFAQLGAQPGAQGQAPTLVVFGAGHWAPASALDTPAADWTQAWHSQCEQGLRVAQAAVRSMRGSAQRQGQTPLGTLIFLGHADGITDAQPARHRAPNTFSAPHAASSAGLRALAQAFARACGPQGIHVAHVALAPRAADAAQRDADTDTDTDAAQSTTTAQAIAQACWLLHKQGRSAWTHELDLRA